MKEDPKPFPAFPHKKLAIVCLILSLLFVPIHIMLFLDSGARMRDEVILGFIVGGFFAIFVRAILFYILLLIPVWIVRFFMKDHHNLMLKEAQEKNNV